MNLHDAILKEHSKAQMLKIVRWIGGDKKRFAELVRVFLHGEYRVTQRAAWPLSYCVQEHPELVAPHLEKLIDNLSKPGLHPAVIRNTVRFLSGIEIPERFLGKLTNTCFRLLQNSASPIAVKVFSMTVLTNIAQKEPGLKREVKMVIEAVLKEGGPALQSRGKKMMKVLGS